MYYTGSDPIYHVEDLATDDSWSLIFPNPSNIVSSVSLLNSTLIVRTFDISLVDSGHDSTYKDYIIFIVVGMSGFN